MNGFLLLFLSRSLSAFIISFPVNDYVIDIHSNYESLSINKDVEQAIIIIHGKLRGASISLSAIEKILDDDLRNKVLVLAPKFKIKPDPRQDNDLFWREGGWQRGDLSHNYKRLSSFSVIDHLLVELADKNQFPKLKDIVIIGHSAGGQFTQRYAALSTKPSEYENLGFTFFVINPSSYIYFSEERPVPNQPNIFIKPLNPQNELDPLFASLSLKEGDHVNKYNNYKYGLTKRNNYSKDLTDEQIIQQYVLRKVYYVIGTDDVGDHMLDKEFPAMLQGQNRFERGRNFKDYMNKFFPDSGHQFIEISEVAHEGAKMIERIQEYLLRGLKG